MNGASANRGATPRGDTRSFPKRHLVAVAAFAVVMGIGLSFLPAGDVAAKRKAVPIELPLAPVEEPLQIAEPTPEPEWKDLVVASGDNLSILFQRAGLTDRHVYDIVHRAKGGKSLTRIFPGQTLGFQLDGNNELLALRYVQSELESTIYRRNEDGYEVKTITREPEVRRSFASAEIDSSLFLAGQDAGMSQTLIMELANIFGGVIDFVLDPRQGDTFYVVYEELYLDGEKFRDGDILAAEFINQGRSYTAFRYLNDDGYPGYYAQDGVSMRKAFLMAPLDFTRISSNFNPKRLHPIYKTSRPHRGTDYAAPRGTPVFASGEGRVIEAGYTRANGNYVVIQHGEQFTTKYLHLHKRQVKKGQRVKQHQVIGSVGSTGAATGPHLHYEFLINGVHRNPRTVHKKLPKAKSLAAAEMPRFNEQTRGFQMQLAAIRQQQLALNQRNTGTAAL